MCQQRSDWPGEALAVDGFRFLPSRWAFDISGACANTRGIHWTIRCMSWPPRIGTSNVSGCLPHFYLARSQILVAFTGSLMNGIECEQVHSYRQDAPGLIKPLLGSIL